MNQIRLESPSESDLERAVNAPTLKAVLSCRVQGNVTHTNWSSGLLGQGPTAHTPWASATAREKARGPVSCFPWYIVFMLRSNQVYPGGRGAIQTRQIKPRVWLCIAFWVILIESSNRHSVTYQLLGRLLWEPQDVTSCPDRLLMFREP